MLGDRFRRRAFAFLLASLMCLATISASGQVSASLSGRITDPTGAVVAAATVTASNLDTGVSRTVLADQSGRYQLLELPVGRYEVHASKAGLADEMRTGIFAGRRTGCHCRPHCSGRTGQAADNCHGECPRRQCFYSGNLRAGGRATGTRPSAQWPQLSTCCSRSIPASSTSRRKKTGGIGVSNSTTGNNFSVSGNRPQQNLFLLNGVEFTGAAENNMQPGGPSQQLLGVEAVREFNVLRDSYGAEYGKRPGAQVIDRHAVGHQSVARLGLRVSAQQRA